MRNRITALCVLMACVLSAAVAQQDERMYIMKGNRVIGAYPLTGVDRVTFEQPAGSEAGTWYAIAAEAGSDYTVSCPSQGESGTQVVFGVTVSNPMTRVDEARANGKACTYIADDGLTWYYAFEMPAGEVTLGVTTAIDRHRITPQRGEHSVLTMLNCCDNWDAAPEDRVFDEAMGGKVKFLWGAELGYTATLRITGQKSGEELPYTYVEDDPTLGKCWQCTMPDEPITLVTQATEKTDYAGRDFVGTYRGYAVTADAGRICRGTSPTFEATLRGNTSFVTSTTDGNAFDFDGCYTLNEDDNTFTYQPEFSTDEYGEMDYGLSGILLGDGNALMFVSDLQNDKPETVKYYFASTTDFGYVAATADAYATRWLIEAERGGTRTWYYFNRNERTVQRVQVRFASGTSVGEACSALVSDLSGKALFRYELASAQGEPTFTLSGREAGTYTPQDGTGSGQQLTLDGFGNATYGLTSGTYSVDAGVVKFTSTADGTVTTFLIDSNTWTYTLANDGTWDGPKNFFFSGSGVYDDDTQSMASLAVTLDSDFSGKEKQGAAKVVAQLTYWYQTKEIIASEGGYTYDAAASTLTLTNVLVGSADGMRMEYMTITFDVSADKRTLTCNEDKMLRATSGGDTRYIPLKGITMQAK